MHQYYQIPVDNKKSNESFRDKAEPEHNENETSNSTTVIEPIDKFINDLLEWQEISYSNILPTPALTITNAIKKELESCYLSPVDQLTFDGNSAKWPEFMDNFKTRVHTIFRKLFKHSEP